MIKKLLGVLLLLVVLAGAGVLYLKNNLDGIVKDALENYGSAATQTDVTIDNVKISLASGEGRISGIAIGNPKSYIAAKALTVGDVTMALDRNSLAQNGPVIIKSLDIIKPHITYEVGADGNSNLQALQKNVTAGTTSAGTTKHSEAKKDTPQRKVIIRDLYIRDGDVNVTHALLKGKVLETKLPLIHLKNIGKEGEGATGQEIAKQVIGSITKAATQSGTQALTQEIGPLKAIGESLKGVGTKLKGLFEN